MVPMVGDADRISKSPNVSSCEQTRSDNALSSSSTTGKSTEKDQKCENNLDEGSTSVGPKGSDKAASDIKIDPDKLYDEINVQVTGFLVDGIQPKESGTVSNSKTVDQYSKTTLRSRKKNQMGSNREKNNVQQGRKTRTACFGEGK